MPETVRLSRQLVESGLSASRREADEAIEMGCVTVDGQVVDTLGCRVAPGQQIVLTPARLAVPPARVTLLLHKPAGVSDALTLLDKSHRSAADHSGWAWLSRCAGHLQVAAELDPAAAGLWVLTQDALLARKLVYEARDYEQEYLLWVADDVSAAALAELTSVARQSPAVGLRISRQGDRQLRIVLRAGPSGLLPHLLAAAGLRLLAWRRQRIGRVALGKLEEGCWRYLQLGERF